MKRFSIFAALMLTATSATAQGINQVDNAWYKAGEAAIAARLAVQPNTNSAKNVIVFIADGNGVGTNYAVRLFHGQQHGNFGDENVLPQEAFPHLALAKTYNTNAQTPDSAGTATAILTGIKTKAGVTNVDETVTRGKCEGVLAGAATPITKIMSDMGKSTGIITTARITHATPASGYANSGDRNFEDNAALPEGCQVPDIAAQLVAAMKEGWVDLAMGGGRRHFLPKTIKGDEGKSGKRTDGRHLIDEVTAMGGQYVWNDTGFQALTSASNGPILGLFESSHMKFEHDRKGEPSLAEMTAAAIKQLSSNENGFFLEIEAGRVDHANHDGNLHRTVTDGVAFADAVEMAAKLTSESDTLIIVTADHEHAIAFGGYCGRGTPITGLCMGIDNAGTKHNGKPQLGKDGKPYTVVGYLNGAGSVLRKDMNWAGVRPDLTQEEATDPDYIQQALIPRSSETHSGEDVAIYARGPWSHLVDGTVEQSYIFHVMHYAATH